MEQTLTIEWVDGGREPQCAPDPAYPTGMDVDISKGAEKTCSTDLPYPAKRCGMFVVRCTKCGFSVAITTAGRPDDPRTLKIACDGKSKRPTIEELEAILNSEETTPLQILPDGTIAKVEGGAKDPLPKVLTMRENLGGEY